MPLSLELYGRVEPRPGLVYVERDEQPATYGTLIHIPSNYRVKVKSALATVHAVGAGVPILRRGDRVLVSAGVGRRIVFGERDEHVVYVCEPAQIIALVVAESETTRIEELGEDFAGRYQGISERTRHALEGRADEGAEKSAGRQ